MSCVFDGVRRKMQIGARIRRVFRQPYLVFVLLRTSGTFPSRVYNDYRQRGCPMWREDSGSRTLSVALFITRHSLLSILHSRIKNENISSVFRSQIPLRLNEDNASVFDSIVALFRADGIYRFQ